MDLDPPSAGRTPDAAQAEGLTAAEHLAAGLQLEDREPSTPRSLSHSRSSLDLFPGAAGVSSPLQVKPFLTPQGKRSREPQRSESPAVSGPARRELSFGNASEEIRGLFRRSSGPAPQRAGEGTHYLALQPLFDLYVDGEYRRPEIYQPTPDGLRVLVAEHQRQNAVDFRVHEKSPETPDTVAARVADFMAHADLSRLSSNRPVAAILSFGQMHAIPIFLAVHEGKKYMLVLDSTSGPIQQQYWAVARDFSEFEVRLNEGTRQADNQSCINDAFEILKQCFTQGNLIERVESRRIAEPEAAAPQPVGNSRLRIRRATQPPNFSLFRLPEELAFVVQRATYLEENQLEMEKPITVNGRTCPLGTHVIIATEFGRKHRAVEDGNMQTERMKVNAYLYKASRSHRAIIEAQLGAANQGG